MKLTALFTVVLLIGALFLTPGCTAPTVDDAGEPAKIQIIATIFPLADIIENIGGEIVETTILLRPGDSPHTFEPTVEQARAVAQADLLFYIGEGLDDWVVGLAGQNGINTVQVTEHLQNWVIGFAPIHLGEDGPTPPQLCDHDHHHHHTAQDPHIWMDPVLVRELLAPLIAEELIKAAPQHEHSITENLNMYQDQLQELHLEILTMVRGFSRKRYISYHSAWNYFAHRYGLEEVAAVEEFPGQEPSAKWLIELVNLAKEHQIDIIFAEPQLGQKAAAVIADEICGRVLFLDPLGGKEVPGRSSYLDLIRYNANLFQEALR